MYVFFALSNNVNCECFGYVLGHLFWFWAHFGQPAFLSSRPTRVPMAWRYTDRSWLSRDVYSLTCFIF